MSNSPILWSASDIKSVFPSAAILPDDWSATGISFDSRTLAQGDLFFAIKTPQSDGHRYIKDAISKGAAALVVDHIPDGLSSDTPLIQVADTLRALEDLGKARRAQFAGHVIAITGSAGKTSTKDGMAIALDDQKKVFKAPSSYNNYLGVPYSLASLPKEADVAIFEVGMNHSGEIRPLTKIIRPHTAVITCVETAHIGNFKGIEQIAEAKSEILEGLAPGGTAILNRDTNCYNILETAACSAKANIITFGESAACDIKMTSYEAFPPKVTVTYQGTPYTYNLGVYGKLQAMNTLAILGACVELGIDTHNALSKLVQYHGTTGRGVHHEITLPQGKITVIDESYNASNTAAIKMALEVLAHIPKTSGRRIAVLGDMVKEEQTPETHASLADPIANTEIDQVHTCGPLMKHLYDKLPERYKGMDFNNVEESIIPILDSLQANDTIMVKGALSSRMGTLVQAILAQDTKLTRSTQA